MDLLVRELTIARPPARGQVRYERPVHTRVAQANSRRVLQRTRRLLARTDTIAVVMEPSARRSFPGLAKVREVPLVHRRSVELCMPHAGRWRDILDAADVVSEGLARLEGGELVYYGTTSLILAHRSAGGTLPDLDVAALSGVLRGDPHVRLRALRIAHREAVARAGAPVATMHAEMQLVTAPRGIAISIDVMARLAGGARTAKSGPR